LQGIAATIIALSGRYEQILNYVVSIDFISFALTAASLFVFRRRDKSESERGDAQATGYRVPGHPYTTALFVLTCACIVISTIFTYPTNSVFGFIILAAGIPVYLYWSRKPGASAPTTL
jgi:basic amino acid/polyamine antiporter, APA family